MDIDYNKAEAQLLKEYGFNGLAINDFVDIAKEYEQTAVLKTKLIPYPERIYAFAKAYDLLLAMAKERGGKVEWKIFYHGDISVTLDKFSIQGLDYETFCMIVDCCSAMDISATYHRLEINITIPDLFLEP